MSFRRVFQRMYKLASLTVTFVLCVSLVAARPSERSLVIRRCAKMYGPMVDHKRVLFSINDFYVLRLKFNNSGRLTQLAVEPKYYYDEDHPEWSEPEDFPNLSKTDYERLLVEVDQIKPKGQLLKPSSPGSFVTNMTAWYRETHALGILEWGEVVDLRRGDDAPLLVRWFRINYSHP